MTESVKSTGSASTVITVKSVPSTCYADLQKENASVLEEILELGNEVTKGDMQDLHLNVFFQMYNEVFPPTVQSKSSEIKIAGKRSEMGVNNPTATVVDKCIRKLREVHRRKFRGGFYQTAGRMELANLMATNDVMKLFNKLADKAFSTESERDESESALKERITLERDWLEKINDWKRQKHFDQIKMEALESFKSAVENEFPFLDMDGDKEVLDGDDNNNKDKIDTMQFYEEQKLKTQLEQTMNAVVFEFKQQIPSEEDSKLVKALELSLRNELLEGSISPILDRNSGNMIRAQRAMHELVEELTTDFKEKMTSFLQESPLLDPPEVLSHHQELVTEYLQSIETKAVEFAGHTEFHVEFKNALNAKIDEIFKQVMGVAFKEAQVSVETCSNRSMECVRKCAQKVEAIFEEFGAARYSSELRDKLETYLMQAIATVRDNTIVNVEKVEKLVESTMSTIYTSVEKAEKITKISESVKARYREKVDELLKLSHNSPLHKSSDFQGFQKAEDNIRNDISKLFRDEIRSQVGDDVDLDRHMNKLHQYISDHWTRALQKIVESLENATKHLPEPEQVNKEANKSKNTNNKKVLKKSSKLPSKSNSKVLVDSLKIQEVKKVIKNVTQTNNKPKVILADQKRPSTSVSVKEAKKRTDSKDMHQTETTFQKQHRNMSELTTTLNRIQQGTHLEKESLPPVVFQMGSARIVTGVVLDFLGPRILENEFGYRYTPALVALTKENTFVYGHAALEILNSTDGGAWQWTNLQKHWWVANHLISGESSKPWSITVSVNGEQKEITVEFLLAFIFRKLKESVQARMFSGVECRTAVITVPIWISSSQRVQIKEAAIISGFSEVHLVNEAASAAYCYINHREARDISMGNLMILSENSDRVDVSIYSYSKFGGCLKMLAHAGHYCLEDTLCPSRNSAKGNFALGESQENVIYWVRQACKQCVTKSKKCQRAYEMPYMKEILVVSQAPEKWADILETIGRDFGRKFGGVRQEEAVIIGACALSQRPKVIGHIIRDQVPYSLVATSGSSSKNGSVVIEADYGLPTKGKLHSVTLLGALQVNFHQSLNCTNKSVWKIPVGNLTILESPPRGGDYYFEPYLEINHEGIVTLKGVNLFCEMDGKCIPVLSEKYRWKPANFHEDKRVQIVSLLEEVHAFQQLSSTIIPKKGKLSKTAQLIRAKKVLARKCREMLDLLENDSMQIKTELGKDIITRRIDEAIRFTEVTSSTLEEVEKQMDALGGIYSKYFLKPARELRRSIVEKQSSVNPTPPPELTDSDRSTEVVTDAITAAGSSVNNNQSDMKFDFKKITNLPVAQSKTKMIL